MIIYGLSLISYLLLFPFYVQLMGFFSFGKKDSFLFKYLALLFFLKLFTIIKLINRLVFIKYGDSFIK